MSTDALMKVTVQCLNAFPVTSEVLNEFSPSSIMGDPCLNCNENLKCPLEECVQVHLDHDETNDAMEHTLNGIHPHPVHNEKTCTKIVNLNSGKVVS